MKRDVDFKEDIALKFDALPKGLTIEPATATVKGAETEAKFLLKAADDAPVGDHVVKVTGTPSKGTLATHDLKISIGKK